MSKRDRQFDYDILDNPSALRHRVLLTSMFIAAYEHLKDRIVEEARSFFKLGEKVAEDFGKDVLSRDKKPDYSTLLWIRENGGISDDELHIYRALTQLRNEVAHEYVRVLTDRDFPNDRIFQGVLDAITIIEMIEYWFFLQSPELAILQAEGKTDVITAVYSPSAMVFKKILLTLFEDERDSNKNVDRDKQ